MNTLSPYVFKRWNDCVAELLKQCKSSLQPQQLMDAIAVLAPFDIGLIDVYGKSINPVNLFDSGLDTFRYPSIESYFDGPYLLDPFYRAGANGLQSGLYHLSDVSPLGFSASEYYEKFYSASKVKDEIGFIIQLENSCFTNISLIRVNHSSFTQEERTNLLNAIPIIQSSIKLLWSENKENYGHQATPLHSQLESALSVFGSSILTKRECEIVNMYLHGHNTKSIADTLCISDHTVSLHRKNSYSKLKISSQAELFHLFIESLSCVDIKQELDPLEVYLREEV